MSRLTDARNTLTLSIGSVVSDRAFRNSADAADTLPAVYPDAIAISEGQNANVVTITAEVLAIVDGDDAAQVDQLDETVDALWSQLLVDGWTMVRATPETRFIANTDEPDSPPLTNRAYRIMARRLFSSPPPEPTPPPAP